MFDELEKISPEVPCENTETLTTQSGYEIIYVTGYSRAAACILAAIFLVFVLFLVFTLPPKNF